jgi:hypothetical protein
VGGHAGKKVYFVCTGDGDQKVCVHNTCVQKHLLSGTVTLYSHYIVAGDSGFQYISALVNEGQVVTFLGKLPQKGCAYFAIACNDNMHKDLTPYKRIVKPL